MICNMMHFIVNSPTQEECN